MIFILKYHTALFVLTILPFICPPISSSQNNATLNIEPQSLIQRVTSWRQNNRIDMKEGETPVKCALHLTFEVLNNYQKLPDDQKASIKKLLQGPGRQTFKSLGHFTVHFDTVGYNVPSLLTPSSKRMLDDTTYVKNHADSINVINAFVDSTLSIFNYVWDIVVNSSGYLPPPFETGENTYNVYITELGGGLYGQTVPSPNPINPGQTPPRYSSYIEIDNDFIAVYSSSRGLPGLRVTAAHEFHHAIQLGSYGYRENDRYFYEITSTWMEDLLYNDVNDYYQYIKYSNGQPRGHFASPNLSLIYSDGSIEYSRAIWGKFIQEKYSQTVMRNAWENMRSNGSVKALDDALLNAGSTLRIAFVEFSRWNYFTASRAIPGRYYSEAPNYPLIKERLPIEMTGNYRIHTDSTQTFSSIYLNIIHNNIPASDVINNINLSSAQNYLIKNYSFNYQMATSGDDTFRQLSNGVFVKLDVSDLTNWSSGGIITSTQRSVTVYPNPCIINKNTNINFTIPAPQNKSLTKIPATLYIYNAGMELVGSFEKDINTTDPKINWNLVDKKGDIVSSGIYLYMIIFDNQEYSGKFAVIKK